MSVITSNFSGDPNIGLYSLATDEYCLVPHLIKKKVEKEIEDALGVKTLKTSLAGTYLIGIFCSGNLNGIILSELTKKHELELLKKHFNVLVLKGKYTAIGNLVVANDKGCIISEKIKKYKEKIEDFLKVKTTVHDIGGLEIVGSITYATSKGCLVSKFALKRDMELIENSLKVKPGYATANFGSNFVKSGLAANSKGAVIGDQSSGPEMQNIVEVLGLI